MLGLLAFAAPFAALPLAKPAAAMPEASVPVLPDAVDTPAATPQPVLPAVPESRSFDADAPILLNDGGEEITVSVQEFLIGIAASELPPDWPDDAVLAQMAAAHSYALSLGGAAFTCNSAQCAGWTDETVLKARWGDDFTTYYSRLAALADEVSGAVLCWDGAPAAACYHSSSAGQTEASQNVWLTAVPYLQGVASPWDADAPGFETSVTYSAEQVYTILTGLGLDTDETPNAPAGWFGEGVLDSAGYVAQMPSAGRCLRAHVCAVRSVCGARRSPWRMTPGRMRLFSPPRLRQRHCRRAVPAQRHGGGRQKRGGYSGVVFSGV